MMMLGMLLVGFKGSETKYTKAAVSFIGVETQQQQVIPAHTELATFETEGSNTKIYYEGQYGYLASKDLVTYNELMNIDPKWKGKTTLDDHTDSSNIILIGDSKTTQMRSVVDATKATWIAEEGAGYEWFTNVAVPMVDEINLSGKKIYIMTGINDLIYSGFSSYQYYVYFMYTKAQEWENKGAEVVFVSVNPIQYYQNVSNELISQYNTNIRESLPSNIEYLDMYTMLGNWGGYATVDGLHYDVNTYRVVYSGLI